MIREQCDRQPNTNILEKVNSLPPCPQPMITGIDPNIFSVRPIPYFVRKNMNENENVL
jgi:hypothetical protein